MKQRIILLAVTMLLIAVQMKSANDESHSATESNIEFLDASILDKAEDTYLLKTYERYKKGEESRIDTYRLEEVVKAYEKSRKYEKAGFGYLLLGYVSKDTESKERYMSKFMSSETAAMKIVKSENRALELKRRVNRVLILILTAVLLVMTVIVNKKRKREKEAAETEETKIREMYQKETEEPLIQKIEQLREKKPKTNAAAEAAAVALFGDMKKDNSKVNNKVLVLLLWLCIDDNFNSKEAHDKLEVGKSQFFALKKLLHSILGMDSKDNLTSEDYRNAAVKYMSEN